MQLIINDPRDAVCLSARACKYYFSCVTAMHRKYPGQGLLPVSLSFLICTHLFLTFTGHDIKSYQFVVKHFLVAGPQGISSNPWQELPRYLSLHFFSAFVYPCKCHMKWEPIGGPDYIGCSVSRVSQPVIISLPQGGRDICCGFRSSPGDHKWLHPNRETFSNGNSCSR